MCINIQMFRHEHEPEACIATENHPKGVKNLDCLWYAAWQLQHHDRLLVNQFSNMVNNSSKVPFFKKVQTSLEWFG